MRTQLANLKTKLFLNGEYLKEERSKTLDAETALGELKFQLECELNNKQLLDDANERLNNTKTHVQKVLSESQKLKIQIEEYKAKEKIQIEKQTANEKLKKHTTRFNSTFERGPNVPMSRFLKPADRTKDDEINELKELQERLMIEVKEKLEKYLEMKLQLFESDRDNKKIKYELTTRRVKSKV
eukprot:UN24854